MFQFDFVLMCSQIEDVNKVFVFENVVLLQILTIHSTTHEHTQKANLVLVRRYRVSFSIFTSGCKQTNEQQKIKPKTKQNKTKGFLFPGRLFLNELVNHQSTTAVSGWLLFGLMSQLKE